MIAFMTPSRASSHEFQNPSSALQPEQRSTGTRGKSASVMKLRTDLEPRKPTMTRELVWSTAT